MAFSSSLKLPPLGPLLSSGHHQLNHNRKIIFPNNSLSLHHSFSDRLPPLVSTALKRDDLFLLEALDSEIECVEDQMDEGGGAIPMGFPFLVHEDYEEGKVFLTREYEGEAIDVEIYHGDLFGESDPPIPMVVTVSKTDGVYLEFEITVHSDDGIVIRRISHPDLITRHIFFAFETLDDNVQLGFHRYLKRRGIKTSAMNVVRDYVWTIMNGEKYIQWLHKLKEFLEE